ncbi:MAG: hypothetical protein MK135_14805, partial [Polyangiaceae bacterium]|nr:hypothetical protein [Polyangiaceae bacterium]
HDWLDGRLEVVELLHALRVFRQRKAHREGAQLLDQLSSEVIPEGQYEKELGFWQKAQGAKWAALRSFEVAAEAKEDPLLNLELAKLYEHLLKDYERALSRAEESVAESSARQAHRKNRLLRKLTGKKNAK